MINEAELTKLYYSIGEVADMLQVNASLIRFWEKEFPALSPKKNKKGNRKFSPADVELLSRIYHLVKVEGHTLEGAKKALKRKTPSPVEENHSSVNEEVIQSLTAIRAKLLSLKR